MCRMLVFYLCSLFLFTSTSLQDVSLSKKITKVTKQLNANLRDINYEITSITYSEDVLKDIKDELKEEKQIQSYIIDKYEHCTTSQRMGELGQWAIRDLNKRINTLKTDFYKNLTMSEIWKNCSDIDKIQLINMGNLGCTNEGHTAIGNLDDTIIMLNRHVRAFNYYLVERAFLQDIHYRLVSMNKLHEIK
ncbi:unnamed protein product [Schistosoma turkestanicum]|nr:unnamed protein product [Schistosoma turkestanicum]